MEIIQNETNTMCPLSSVNTGEVFQYFDQFYIKVSVTAYVYYGETNIVNICNLTTGKLKELNPQVLVKPVKAKLIITE